MKLNVACGDDVRPDMVNVDYRPTGDVVGDVRALPFRDGAFDEVLASDILEHVTDAHALLKEWSRVLSFEGRLTVKVPNLKLIAATLLESPNMAANLIRNIYGGHRWGPDGAWDTHHHGWTPHTLQQDLDRHGFWLKSNDEELNMTVEAVKV